MKSAWSKCAALTAAVSIAAWCGSNLLQQAPVRANQRRNPYEGQERARAAGAKLYVRECASCHGDSGEGIGHAPPLNSPLIHHSSPGALFWVLRNGAVFRGMPSFSHLPEAQRWQIVTYLKSEL